MNGRFVLTSQVSPPQGRTVMVRSGGSVFSAALRGSGGWVLIYGSGETPVPNPPEEWWLEDALAKEMGLDIDRMARSTEWCHRADEKVIPSFP